MAENDRSTRDGVSRPLQPSWAGPLDQLDALDSIPPTVLILGGFMTGPPMYRSLARCLRERGAAGVVVANVWTPDWLLAGARGIGPICTRSARALLAAGRLSAEVSGGAPVLVVGHSAGGVTARLLTAPEPVAGRRFGAASRIGAIATLGTPHRLAAGEGIGSRMNEVGASLAEAAVPGAFFAPKIGYVSVASRAITGEPAGAGRQRVAHLLYRSVIGRAAVPGTEGDGLVPAVAARLDGATQVTLDDAAHSPGTMGEWYGSERSLDVWWPVALEVWRGALRARVGGTPSDRHV
ncbi:MAG TPA: hypothetical protein VF337_08200 [Candidatus Limnocylindrales bacterium]